jgi:uncharacterized circularly permuted ATP-grasp superfamily protein/uncharacterized alpha-E superfamily protein
MQPTAHAPASSSPWRVTDEYHGEGCAYDEIFSEDAQIRPHYQPLVRALEALGRHEFMVRAESAKRAIRDNGVTYNVYGDPQGVDRPWTLDMMPLVVPSHEWSWLEAGLRQRSRLLNAILQDIYGPQRLLRERLLPASLVLGNPAFLRPCRGIDVPARVYLHLHAVDLARSPNGQWVVLGDRTQAPSGAGYALENRIVLSRTLPEAYRDLHIERLAPFFRAHRDTVIAMGARGVGAGPAGELPQVVLLTPGPLNETYFEHAYLARYLGFTLVEGGDLTVRDRHVFIKTLDGLRRVDVILRRMDDSFCDPLELRSDSALGVAGLVEAVRCGNVAIANPLGSGVVESPAFAVFLPGLCRELLGEELTLPSVSTWWCGVPQDREFVIANLDRLVIKQASPPVASQPVFGRTLGPTQKAALVAAIRQDPDHFVGQDEVRPSNAPVWLAQHLEPRPLGLRAYIAATGDGHVVMPGGLTRVAGGGNVPVVSMQRGGGSKDTWVLSDGPVTPVSLLAPSTPTILRERRTVDLPSRVADNLFWLGRHAERAEHTARLLRNVVACLADENTTEDTPELRAILDVLVQVDLLLPSVLPPRPLRELEQDLLAQLFNPEAAMGLGQTLVDLRRNATAVRDRLSADTWRILNQLRHDFRLRHGRIQLDDVLLHLNRMITDLAAFSGMEMENMTRGHGWRFLDIGRRLERAVNLSRLLSASLHAEPSPLAMLSPLLDIADSTITYRRRYFALPQLVPVMDLLLSDGTNARSLAFQIAVLTDHVNELPRDKNAPSPTREQRHVTRVAELLNAADLDVVGQSDPNGQYEHLTELLRAMDDVLRLLSDTVTYYYFSHAEQRVS